MLNFAPRLYEDELIYSYVGRWHRLSGLHRREDFLAMAELSDCPLLAPRSYGRISVKTAFHEVADKRQVLFDHTTFPYYRPFLSKENRSDVEWGTYAGRKGLRRHWIHYSDLGAANLRTCSECAREQQEDHGVTFWTRSHNLPFVTTCHRHGIRLQFGTDTSTTAANDRFFMPEIHTGRAVMASPNEFLFACGSADLLGLGGGPIPSAHEIKRRWRMQVSEWTGGTVKSPRGLRSVKDLLGRAIRDLGLDFTDEYVGSARFDKKVSELYSHIIFKSDPVFNVLMGMALGKEVGKIELLRTCEAEPVKFDTEMAHAANDTAIGKDDFIETPGFLQAVDRELVSHPPAAARVVHTFSQDLIRFGNRLVAA